MKNYKALEFFVNNYGKNGDVHEFELDIFDKDLNNENNELFTNKSVETKISKKGLSSENYKFQIMSFFEEMLAEYKGEIFKEDINQFKYSVGFYNSLKFRIFLFEISEEKRRIIVRFIPDNQTGWFLKKEIERMKEKCIILSNVNISDDDQIKIKRI